VFIDEASLVVGGSTADAEGFESGVEPWSTAAPPAGSPAISVRFRRAQALLLSAVSTRDRVRLGPRIEQFGSRAEQRKVPGGALRQLLATTPPHGTSRPSVG
jgi:hypothetical protein